MSASSPSSARKPQSDGKGGVFDRRRRKTPRFFASFPVTIITLNPENGYTHLQGQAQDLSVSGLGMLLPTDLVVGEVVTVTFSLPPIPFELLAVVRHRRACRYGLEFLGLSEKQKAHILDFVKDLPSAG